MSKKNLVTLKDRDNQKVELLSNWNNKDKETTYLLRFELGTCEARLTREDIVGLAFIVGDSQDQEKLVNSTGELKRRFEKTVTVKADNDIKKGEEVVFKLAFDIPEEEIRQLIAESDAQK